MSFNFPNFPSEGQTYTPSGGPTYIYRNGAWMYSTSPTIAVSDAPPNLLPGALWWESDSGNLFVNYFDGDSTQWVHIAGGGSNQTFGPVLALRDGGTTGTSMLGGIEMYDAANTQHMKVGMDGTGSAITPASTGLRVKGAMTVDQTLGVTGNTTVGGTLGVTGASTLAAVNATSIGATTPGSAVFTSLTVNNSDTAWKPMPYINGWVDYAAPYGPCGYRKLSSGLVIFRGLAMSGTAAGMATMPVGYRPATTVLLIAETSPNAACRLDVTAAGAISHTGGNNGWISLCNITYLAEN